MHVKHLVALLAAIMCVRRGQAGVSSTQSLPNFNNVTVAVPLNVMITPSSGYSLVVDAEQQVMNALKATVSNNVLNLESYGDFQSNQPIKIIVNLPQDQLSQVNNIASSNLVVVDTGFAVGELTANLAGTGTVYFASIDAPQVTIDSSG